MNVVPQHRRLKTRQALPQLVLVLVRGVLVVVVVLHHWKFSEKVVFSVLRAGSNITKQMHILVWSKR